jgi:hypothetical protein
MGHTCSAETIPPFLPVYHAMYHDAEVVSTRNPTEYKTTAAKLPPLSAIIYGALISLSVVVTISRV